MTSKNTDQGPSRQRSIRFKNSLWEQIEKDGERRDLKPSQVVTGIVEQHFNSGGELGSMQSTLEEIKKAVANGETEDAAAIKEALENVAEMIASQAELAETMPVLLKEFSESFAAMTNNIQELLQDAEVVTVKDVTAAVN